MDTGVCLCRDGKQQIVLIKRGAANSTGSRRGCVCLRDMIYEIYMQVFVRRILLCVYWSAIVYSNRCWLCEMHPPLCSLQRFNPLRVAFCFFVLLFKPSSGWKCDSVTVTCHFLFISTDDKASSFFFFFFFSTFGILLHTWVFPTDLSSLFLLLLKDKC